MIFVLSCAYPMPKNWCYINTWVIIFFKMKQSDWSSVAWILGQMWRIQKTYEWLWFVVIIMIKSDYHHHCSLGSTNRSLQETGDCVKVIPPPNLNLRRPQTSYWKCFQDWPGVFAHTLHKICAYKSKLRQNTTIRHINLSFQYILYERQFFSRLLLIFA